jgi:FSR family fosmidomycin resistance protein-like MFS transporter
LDNPAQHSLRRDARVIGLVGFAHALSHFFQLALPPLFPLLRAEFDVSWSALGALVATFYVASALTQFGAGFVVDRLGARPVLFGGLALLAGGTALTSLAPGFYWLYPLAALMGVGNGVFHPVDFAILNASVAPRRLGHAYSMHGVGGSLGYALAPVVSFALGAWLGWRGALGAMGALGLVALGVLATQRAFLTCHVGKGRAPQVHGSAAALFRQPAILACFAYFLIYTTGTIGLQTFAPATLNAIYDLPLALATSAVTAMILGATAGIVTGGFIAGRTRRHGHVAAMGLATGAIIVLFLALAHPPAAALLPLFAAIGFSYGITGPSRDMIVKAATPVGASGRVYGFVYSGLDLGSMLGPLWFGAMLDHGAARGVLFAVAGCFLTAILTVVQVRRATPLAAARVH